MGKGFLLDLLMLFYFLCFAYAMHLYGVRIDNSKFSNSNTRYLLAVHEFWLLALSFSSSFI